MDDALINDYEDAFEPIIAMVKLERVMDGIGLEDERSRVFHAGFGPYYMELFRDDFSDDITLERLRQRFRESNQTVREAAIFANRILDLILIVAGGVYRKKPTEIIETQEKFVGMVNDFYGQPVLMWQNGVLKFVNETVAEELVNSPWVNISPDPIRSLKPAQAKAENVEKFYRESIERFMVGLHQTVPDTDGAQSFVRLVLETFFRTVTENWRQTPKKLTKDVIRETFRTQVVSSKAFTISEIFYATQVLLSYFTWLGLIEEVVPDEMAFKLMDTIMDEGDAFLKLSLRKTVAEGIENPL
jgi:hypothetical protein